MAFSPGTDGLSQGGETAAAELKEKKWAEESEAQGPRDSERSQRCNWWQGGRDATKGGGGHGAGEAEELLRFQSLPRPLV